MGHKQGFTRSKVNTGRFSISRIVLGFSIILTPIISVSVEAADPSWGLDKPQGTLLKPGISPTTFLATENSGTDGKYSLEVHDIRSVSTANNRPISTPSVYRHPDWSLDSAQNIGNVFGLAIDDERYIYTTASAHYGSEVGYSGGGNNREAVNAYGTIGGGINDLGAAGTIYKLDKVTGAASVFAQLPQQSSSITHVSCEANKTHNRTTGPALGNIAYDPIHNQFFVSNFEDGKIYRLDKAGNVLDSFDPWAADDGSAGLASDRKPYGLAVNPDGSKLFFGTMEAVLNVEGSTNSNANSPGVYSVDLAGDGSFSGSESSRLIQLKGDNNNASIGSTFAKNPGWVAISDLEFAPDGKLVAGIRTGCGGTLYSSHNHGGTQYTLNSSATSIVIKANMRFNNKHGPDDGYGGLAVYDYCVLDGAAPKYDYLATSSDIKQESGPHGVMIFPHDFTNTGTASRLEPAGGYAYTSTSASKDLKGVGGDVEVLDMEKDFADAPDSYLTLKASGGPSHLLTGDGLLIGTTVDNETDGQTSADALGDDTNTNGLSGDTDDEDGFASAISLTPGGSGVIDVPVKNPTAVDATLYAWIDLNGDGDFNDPGEFQQIAVPAGTDGDVQLDFGTLPSDLSNTFARFRITTDTLTATDFGGSASDGEVEDHPVTVKVPPQPMSIGSLIWEDKNLDGLQGDAADEPRISGAKVNLLVKDGSGNFIPATDLNSDPVSEITTGPNGQYHFTNLPEGEYKVTVDMPSGYVASPNQNVSGSADGDFEDDSNIDTALTSGASFTSGSITLEAGDEPTETGNFDGDELDDSLVETNGNMTLDFGFVQLGSWSGNVSQDTNNDDVGDVNLPAVTIELFNDTDGDGQPDGAAVASTTTDSDGNYVFSDLQPGDYVAVETQPAGLDNVKEDEGGLDNDKPDNGTINSIAGSVSSGENDANNDFVEEALLGSWSGNVSQDTNNDDVGDVNLPAVTIELFNDTDGDGQPDGAAVASTTTDSDGNYVFSDLQPGDYVAVETQPAGLDNVKEDEGGLDNDKPDNGTINSIAGSVSAGENDANNDFVEEAPLGSWSGNVSQDTNNDDVGDVNLLAVTIELFNDTDGDGQPDGAAVASTTTDSDGNYVFSDLQPGDYVAVETQPAGLDNVKEDEGGLDNDKPDNGTVNSIAGTVSAGENDANNDFVEEAPLGSWSGNVSQDTNNDNVGDVNLPAVTIKLFADTNGDGQPDGAAVATTTTDTDGNYVFENLQPGDYVAVETQPAGLDNVKEDEGGLDNDKPDNGTINSIAGSVSAGENDANNDFVEEAPLGSWSGNVSQDTNNDNVGDVNLPAVTIELFNDTDGDGQPDGAAVASTTTDSDGNYVFSDLQPGDYVAVETQPAGLDNVKEDEGGLDNDKPDNGTINSIAGSVSAGENDANNDFVEEAPLGSWSGNVSQDTNNDNVGDVNLPAVTIELFNDTDGDGQPDGAAVASTTTDSDGNYVFSDLQPGDYVAVETQPAGLDNVKEDEGGLDNDKPDNGTINSIAGSVSAGENDANNDFVEEAPLGSWSGNVSQDTNNDNVGDVNLPAVTIELFNDTDGDGQPDGAAVASTTTDSDGNYVFSDLQPGDYVAVETQPAGLDNVKEDEGGLDNDKPDNGTINSIAGSVSAGENDANNDFVEEAPLGSWSGNVSQDTNNDNVGDVNLPAVTIELFNDTDGDGQPDGAAVASTTTDSDGNYVFSDLQPGDYVAVETQPAGLDNVKEDEGGLDNDKPDNGTINSIAGSVSSGENDANNDFVEEAPLGSLSGNVSQDTNNDNMGDVNLPNVTLELFADTDGDGQPDGPAVATTTTDTDGNYVFSDLTSGNYVVIETQPAGLNDVSEDEGGIDNDQGDNGVVNSIAAKVDAGENDANNDFVEVAPLGSLSGNVSQDTNNDNMGDVNLPNVTLELFADTDGDGQPDGPAVATTTTDTDGNYVFSDLTSGNYVVIETQPAGLNDVSEDEGGIDNDQGDNGVINSIAAKVDAGENDANNDFVEKNPLGSWSGNVSVDTNNDNIGDLNLPLITIELFKDTDGDGQPDGSAIATTMTDADGNYVFTDLEPGNYVAVETQPVGFDNVKEDEGGLDNDQGDNSSINSIAGKVDAGENDSNNDFVEVQLGAISGNVSEEINGGSSLKGIPGVTLQLFNAAGKLVATTTTDSEGNYQFLNLVPGAYRVVELQPGGFDTVSDADNGQENVIQDINVTAGSTVSTRDFVEKLSPAAPIPTLSEWMLMLLVLLLLITGRRESLRSLRQKY